MTGRPRVVLIEDNEADVYLVELALSTRGIVCELTRFEDGEAALNALSRSGVDDPPPDLILLDLNLPRVNGMQVVKAARAIPALAAVPIAVMSSSFSPRDREDALGLGADRYVHKPAGLRDCLDAMGQTVEELLGQGSRPEC